MSDNHHSKPLVLVDGSSYLYRAFHALPPLTTSRGTPTGAVYGVANMLRRLLADFDSDRMAVVFDAPGRTFRDDIYPEYKATRKKMPDELSMQIAPLHEVVRAMGFPLLMEQGVEADDVIGTLARRALEAGIPVVISTGDKDMAQLVDGGITLVNTMTETVMDREMVMQKFGVPPERIIDFLALVGDTSDNIPGVPKVGPKTAAKWLNEYGDLDAVIAHADDIKGKIGDNLRASLEQLPMARELATIRCDVELPIELEQLHLAEPDRAALTELFTRLEFKGWLAEQLAETPDQPVTSRAAANYETICDEAALERWIKRIAEAELFAFDTETTSLDANEAVICGVSFALESGEAAYVPCGHICPGDPDQLDREVVLERLRPLLEDPAILKVGQNLKYDMSVLAGHGITLRGIAHDVMLESYVLDSTATRHDMDSLALKYLGHKTITFEEVAGKGAKQITFDQVPVEQAAEYAAEDADITLQLHHHLWPRLSAEPGLRKLYESIEVPLVPVLSRMERRGVLVDVERLRRQSGELAARMQELEQQAYAEAGQPFNLGSPKQIQALLFEKQGLPVLAKTPKGQPSTAENVLQELALDYPLPRLILEHRGMSKLKSTYTDRLPEQVNRKTGRVHTSYHQAVAATGRLSSSDPNLQNIPVRTAEGRRIRQAFIAPEGYKLLAADYSQIELRIMAHLSGDEGLLRAFENGDDIHRATAAEVFGTPVDAVTGEQRRSAKAINFGLIYGMSAFGLARQLGIDRAAAQLYVDRYFERYPGVRAYMERTREMAREQGYVETVFGRRLHIPDIKASNGQRRQAAERTAINAPMQGTAADIIKRAMIAVDAWLEAGEADARMIMQVHDELVFEVAGDAVEVVGARIREHMESAAELSVRLEVDIGVGDNWDEAH